MRADTIEEPAVVADDDGTAGKGLKTFFECSQGVHVDIVGRLVEQQHIALLLQGDGQMQTVTLTTRQHTAFLFLVSTAEVKTTKVCTHVDILTSHADGLVALRYYLINGFCRVDVLMLLVNITELYRLAYCKRACISLFQTHYQSE